MCSKAFISNDFSDFCEKVAAILGGAVKSMLS
jgi:hypothetical protein